MKAGVNYIPLAEIVKAIEARADTKIEQKKGWLKVTGPATAHTLYVRDTKSCGLVHVSGMTDKDELLELTVPIPKPPTGRCTRMLDFGRDNKGLLADLEEILDGFIGSKKPAPEAEPEAEPEFAQGEPDPIALTGDAPKA